MTSFRDQEIEFFRNRDQESLMVRGAATAPALNAAIATIAAPPAGTYEIEIISRYGATPDVVGSTEVRIQNVSLVILPIQAIANGIGEHFTFVRRLNGAQNISINAVVTGAVGSVYLAHIIATKIGDL